MRLTFHYILSVFLVAACQLNFGSMMAVPASKDSVLWVDRHYEDVYLWKDGNFPVKNGDEDKVVDPKERWVARPFMRIFRAESAKATGRAVVCLPGGGYSHLSWFNEGYNWAPYFNDQGITLIVLNYRMPRGNYQVPVGDVYECIRYVRENAQLLQINPNDVGIMGFSAGGHLASTVATHAQKPVRPDFQILFYPVITMDTVYTHRGTHDNLIGKHPTEEMVRLFSNELQVDSLTPPAILLLSDDDRAVPSPNGVNYYLALKKNKVQSTLHVYPSGGHGWGMKSEFRFHEAMLKDLFDWLQQLKPKK